METQKWNFEKDIVVTDAPTMFTIDEAKKIEIGVFCVNSQNGIFYQKRRGETYDIKLKNNMGISTIMKNSFVSASDGKYGCFIVHNEKTSENYLLDTRGIFYSLPKVSEGVFLGAGQYSLDLNKSTGLYLMRDWQGKLIWEIRAMSENDVKQYAIETAANENLSLNPNFEEFLKKLVFDKKENRKFLYLTCGNDKQGLITKWCLTRNLPYENVPNVFEDDDTINIRIEVERDNIKNDDVMYLCTKYKSKFSIFNIPIECFLSVMTISYLSRHKFNLFLPSLEGSYEKMCVSILNTLKSVLSSKVDKVIYKKVFEPILNTFYFGVDRYKNDTFNYFYVPTRDGEVEPVENPFMHKSILQSYESKLLSEMQLNGISISKWENEATMFEIIHKDFPDAIYQYRDKWLGQQSIDVYVPSLKIGFEYQGIQHYEAVEFFGGKEALLETQKRDKKKKELCEKNDVKIIYWKYDEPVNQIVLRKKLLD